MTSITSHGQRLQAPETHHTHNDPAGNAKHPGGNGVNNTAHTEFDALGFYSRAHVIWSEYMQQQEDVLYRISCDNAKVGVGKEKNTSEAKVTNTASREHEDLLNSFALLLSRKRNYTKRSRVKGSSASQVTATALQKTEPATGNGGHTYTLYIAKNGGLGNEDTALLESMENWMNWKGGDEDLNVKNKDWTLVIRHVHDRVQSYLTFKSHNKFIKCRIQLKEKHPFPSQDTNGLPFSADLSCLLNRIESGGSYFHHGILIECYNFVQNHSHTLNSLDWRKMKYPEQADYLQFVIIGIQKLAKIPRAFKNILKFRKLSIAQGINTFQIVHVQLCKGSIESHPGMFNVQSNIKEIAENKQYKHINKKLEEIAEAITSPDPLPMGAHCEIQLLDYMLQQSATNSFLLPEMYDFIGCSKRPCYLCAGTINLGTPFRVADSHWKLYSAWGLPRALLGNEEIVNALSSLWVKMDLILRDLIWRDGIRGPRSNSSSTENDSSKSGCIEWNWNPKLAPESP